MSSYKVDGRGVRQARETLVFTIDPNPQRKLSRSLLCQVANWVFAESANTSTPDNPGTKGALWPTNCQLSALIAHPTVPVECKGCETLLRPR